jgi:hypothetical protein
VLLADQFVKGLRAEEISERRSLLQALGDGVVEE